MAIGAFCLWHVPPSLTNAIPISGYPFLPSDPVRAADFWTGAVGPQLLVVSSNACSTVLNESMRTFVAQFNHALLHSALAAKFSRNGYHVAVVTAFCGAVWLNIYALGWNQRVRLQFNCVYVGGLSIEK